MGVSGLPRAHNRKTEFSAGQSALALRFSQNLGESFHGIGLLEQGKAVVPLFDQNVTVPARQHDREVRPTFAESAPELYAAHAGHHHVGEDNIKVVLIAEMLQRFFRGRGQGGLKPQVAKQLSGEGADILIILHHKHTAAAAVRRGVMGRHFP